MAQVRAAHALATLERAGDGRVELSWRPEGEAERLLVALPAGTRARPAGLLRVDGAVAPLEALRVVPARLGRLNVAEARLDPAALPPGTGEWRVVLELVDAAPDDEGDDDAADSAALRRLGILDGRSAAPARVTRRPRAKAFGSGRVEILIDRDGIYRITHAQLAASGADLSGVRLDELRLTSRGLASSSRELPLRVHDSDGDGLLGAGDWLELYGRALVGESVSGAFQQGDFGDVNAYFLDVEPGTRLRMATRDGRPSPSSPTLSETLATARFERDDFFLANHRVGLPDVDHFYSCPSLVTGGPTESRVETLALPGLVRGSSLRATVRARLLGRTSVASVSPDHDVELSVGAMPVSRVDADGYAVIDHDARGLDPALLSDPVAVTVRLPGVPGVATERCELNWIEVDYPRALVAESDRLALRVVAPGRATVTALGSTDVSVLDVSAPDAPVVLANLTPSGGSVSFEVAGLGERRLAVASHPAGEPTFRPRAVRWLPDAGLHDASLAVDVLVVGPAAWVAPPLPGVQRWVDLRESQGLRVKLVSTEEISEQLDDGLFTPFGTSRLLATALSEWRVAPRYCVLLGDATVDYKDALGGRLVSPTDCSLLPDPCGTLEPAHAQFVPTLVVDNPSDQTYTGYFASDVLLALVAGADWLPDVALGRIPARSGAEVEALLDKIRDYEALALAPPAWATRVFSVGDRVVPGQEVIESAQEEAAAAWMPGCYERRTFYYQSDYGATAPERLTADLLAAWNDPAEGAAIVTYVGHGGTFTWSSDALLTNVGAGCRDDAVSLADPAASMPVVLNVDCVAGGFMGLNGPGLLEDLVRRPTGGAIAAFGPTGITDLAFAPTITDAFLRAWGGPDGRGVRLGDVILAVQASLSGSAEAGSPEELESNVLLGDPSLVLVTPFAPPARGLRATASDAQVALDWDAVPGADAYALYRSDAGDGGPWTRVATGVAGTSWTDAGVDNGVTYHYVVEPLAACRPGRWSDPVAAHPCGLARPEPPSGFVEISDDCTGQVVLAWQASGSPGLAGYVLRVHEGLDATLPPVEVRSIPGRLAVVRDLVPFRWYTFMLTAADGCGVESRPAVPLTLRPDCPLAVDAPSFVTDLRVRRSGDDVVLSWSPVTTTLRGDALTPAAYVVHAAGRPDFLADATTLAGRVPVPGTALTRRVGDGRSLELFAVAAESASGARGGIGHDLPQGVMGLVRADRDATTYLISWPAVRGDVRGERTPIARYDVYASTTPLARPDVDLMTPTLSVTDLDAVVDRAAGQYHFVVAEDVHGNRSAY